MFTCWFFIECCKDRLQQTKCGIFGKEISNHVNPWHINVLYHFVKVMVEDKKVLLENIDTLKNVADSLTKYVSIEKFSSCRESIDIDYLNM